MLRHRKDQCDKIQYPKTIHKSSALLTYLAIHQGQVLPWWQHLFVSQSMLGKKINRFFKASELQAESSWRMDRNGQLQNQTKNLMDKHNQYKDLKLKTESLLQDSRTILLPQKNNPQSWAVRGTCEAISISFNIHFQKLKKASTTCCKILHDSNVSQFRVTGSSLHQGTRSTTLSQAFVQGIYSTQALNMEVATKEMTPETQNWSSSSLCGFFLWDPMNIDV